MYKPDSGIDGDLLIEKNKLLKKWKQRYCTFDSNTGIFKYFKGLQELEHKSDPDEPAEQPMDSLSITEGSIVKTELKKRFCTFSITGISQKDNKKKTIACEAENKNEFDKWVETMSSFIKSHNKNKEVEKKFEETETSHDIQFDKDGNWIA